jgi:hypothetical protein
MFENGTVATKQIGYFDDEADSWFLKTDDKQYAEATLRTIVRGCSNQNRLSEVFSRFTMKKNTRP